MGWTVTEREAYKKGKNIVFMVQGQDAGDMAEGAGMGTNFPCNIGPYLTKMYQVLELHL